ncbi:MAG: 16S rRNA (cytosine(1402)-N(4))-methyltransferase RsmH [Gemmatimonadetes bacterium]|nr:16S rRNA (cytosine(1402)-N(4))-methyltransferase RsmH [Gemmatimonadota bacterium]
MRYHEPALVQEVVGLLEPAGRGEIMDGTVGGGGHAAALLDRYRECRILGVDRDPEALAASREALRPYGDRVRLVEARFDEAARTASANGPSLSGALLDLGVSTHQLDEDARGFSFRADAPLDMRMSQADAEAPTAADILNKASEDELRRVFREYGEVRRAARLAKAVTLLRGDRPFRVADDLVEAIAKAFRHRPTPSEKAQIFQALRIEVNRELESLEAALPRIRDALLPGGVLAIISYHSLEDRQVKRAFLDWSRKCVCPPELPICVCEGKADGTLLTRRVVRPGEAEVTRNPRTRSARLRGWRKAA